MGSRLHARLYVFYAFVTTHPIFFLFDDETSNAGASDRGILAVGDGQGACPARGMMQDDLLGYQTKIRNGQGPSARPRDQDRLGGLRLERRAIRSVTVQSLNELDGVGNRDSVISGF